MHARTVVALLAVIGLAYACGSRAREFSLVMAGTTTGAGSERATLSAVSLAHPHTGSALASTLDVDVRGDEVRFVLRVTNTSNKKLELTFPNGQTHDLAVLNAAGDEVWRWGSGQMFTQALRNQPLDAHASIVYMARWRQPAAHGPLTAVATLTSTNYPVESRAPFALP
jgi:hypothetical protein